MLLVAVLVCVAVMAQPAVVVCPCAEARAARPLAAVWLWPVAAVMVAALAVSAWVLLRLVLPA